ncbi:hypothetical protein AMS68_007288 [Peltaster fructicola]|uniref:VHS domain-containing protein n=1 Tax=Peltaster fructicola TaxID=286661 RepID=A0A6H0Y4C7_9PEZI|nr:hypothetical protein AMS68_007288 [Peltaster fructicola]
MFSGPKKPYTAVTVQIDRLTSEQYEEDDITGIIDLVEVIRIQSSGPSEAARAIRKKLKYGNTHRQIRALTILDGLIENAGSRFQRTFVDEPLLERLRLLPRDDVVDAQVRQKAKILFIQWSKAYSNTPGLERIASLYKELPKSQKPIAARQKVLRDTEPLESESEPSPISPKPHARNPSSSISASPISPARPVALSSTASSSFSSKLTKMKKDRQGKGFNLAKEKDNMTTCIANASMASTNLLNGLQLIHREAERVSDNKEVVQRFEICKSLRREILRFIQHVESDEWIGSLVNANDELVKALTAFEIMDKSVSDDSDSDAWENVDPKTRTKRAPSQAAVPSLADLSLSNAPPKPPRPQSIPMPVMASSSKQPGDEDEDDDNPFGDSQRPHTPQRPPTPLIPRTPSGRTVADDRSETRSLVDTINRLRHDESSPPLPDLLPYPTDDEKAMEPTEGDDALQKIANAEARRESIRRASLSASPSQSKSRMPRDPMLASPRRASYQRAARTASLVSVNEDEILGRSLWSQAALTNDVGTQTEVCGYHLEAL